MKVIFLMLQAFVIVIFAMSSFAQTNKRNLKNYEYGPNVEIALYGKNENIKRVVTEFLWKNWTEKKLAFFDVRYLTREGNTTPCRYFIEDINGSWQIAEECDHKDTCPYISSKDCRKYRLSKTIYSEVEKVDQQNGVMTLRLYNKTSKGEQIF